MKKDKWYKRLLCGYNTVGDTADLLCRGTEVTYHLTDTERMTGEVQTRCWCCTFWRGVVVGAAVAALGMFGVLYAL